MRNVQTELAKIEAQVRSVNDAMLKVAQRPKGEGFNTDFLKRYADEVRDLEKGFHSAIDAQGAFNRQSMKVVPHADRLTEMIQRQKFGVKELIREHKNLGEVYRNQMALQKSVVMQWGRDSSGAIRGDLLTPRVAEQASRGFAEMAKRAGFYNQVLASVADQTVKWGKNTQWAGRQLMAGLSMPIAAAAAGTGYLAYQIDKGLTQVVKVYGDASTAAKTTDAEIKAATMSTARSMAATYGQSAQDTIEITSQLASAGKVGKDLQQATAEVTRARTLGELNLQDAMKATITLQSVYDMNSQKLGETFNFMNQMENQTALTMQDFVVGIPKVSGVLKEFGGTVQDAGVLLAGMKAAGIDAAEGANAIKSIAFKSIAPNQGSKDLFEQLTGKSFDQTMEGTDGVVERLVRLSESIQNLGEEERVGLIQKMFGLYQGSKTLSLLGQLTGSGEQMARAFEVAGSGAAEWAETANREIEKLTQSNWQQIKQQWEVLRLQLAKVGEAALAIAPPIMKFFSGILSWFEGLDPGIKKLALIALGITALIGPAIMLAGLLGNLIGNVGKFTTFMSGLALKFRFTNAEQKMAAALANGVTDTFISEEFAAKHLAIQINEVAQALNRLNREQALANRGLVGVTTHPVTGNLVREMDDGRYGPVNKNQAAAYDDIMKEYDEKALKNSAGVAANSEVTKRNWGAIAGNAAMFGTMATGAMGTMATESGSTLNTLTNTLFIASMIGPSMAKGLGKGKILEKFREINTTINGGKLSTRMNGIADKGGAAISRWVAGARALGPALAAAGPIALAVGATIGAAWYGVHKAIEQTRKDTQEAAGSAKDYATLVGYAFTEGAQKIEESGEKVDAFETKVQKLKEANSGLAKQFEDMRTATDDEKLAFAINEGTKARLHGATKQQAEEAAAIALKAMGSKLNEQELTAKIRGEIDFDDNRDLLRQQGAEMARIVNDGYNQQAKQSKWETFGRLITGNDDINTKTAEQIAAQTKQMWQFWTEQEGTARNEAFNMAARNAMSGVDDMFTKLQKKYGTKLADAGIFNSNDLLQQIKAKGASGMIKDVGGPGAFMSREEAQSLEIAADASKKFVKEWMELNNMPFNENIWNAWTLKDVSTESYMDVTTVAKAYTEQLAAQEKGTYKAGEAEKLATLNHYRAMAGLGAATSSSQGFTDALGAENAALAQNAEAARNATIWKDRFSGGSATAEDLTGAMKNYFTSGQQTVLDAANRQFDDAMSAAMDGLQKEAEAARAILDAESEAMDNKFEARADAMESRWDRTMDKFKDDWDARRLAVKNSYDSQVDGIQRAIEAEKKAEETRQRIFEAEKVRIQRLADLYNRNIDINAAIRTGNLDEAAKLQNDAQSTQDGWIIDDAAGQTQSVSDAAIEKMENRIDTIEKARDARLQSLEKVEEAEKRALEAKKKREQEALEAERDRYNKSMDARKKAADETARSVEAGKRREWEAAKRALDLEMEALLAHIPTTQAELNAHIVKIEKAYGKYGFDLQRKGQGWAGEIGKALETRMKIAQGAMQSEIQWKNLGAAAAANFVDGAFGMSVSKFMNWIATGVVPPEALAKVTAQERKAPRVSDGYSGGITKHKGGIIGMGGSNSRAGYSGKNLSQSEVQLTALKGEAVLNRNATRHLGTDFVDMANKGILPKNIGGPDLTGLMGNTAMMLGGALRAAMSMAVSTAAARRFSADAGMAGEYGAVAGKAGKYGDINFTAEQLRNAATIGGTAKSLGASNRDIVIALMTAMQESSLRNINYGDRDSLGLFQQRAAWGSAADRTNPVAATRMFFHGGKAGQRGLFDFPNRGKMSLGQAAQAVQVSAFPGAYAKWENEALAILGSLSFAQQGGSPLAIGGWTRPASGPRTSPFGMRWGRMHTGSDIGAPHGAPIRAARSGRVIFAGVRGGKGNHIQIDHGGGIQTGYSHQSRFAVGPGANVSGGQTIGYVGNTGNSTGPHLHFEYIKNGTPLNPNLIIPGMKTGGYTMSDGLAMLHKNETVLTSPLSQNLKDGINNMDKSQHVVYDVKMDFSNASVRDASDINNIKKSVKAALMEIEKEKGLKRRVGDRY